MVRKLLEKDKQKYLDMTAEFYTSEAVLHNINQNNTLTTFNLLMNNSPYADAYIIEYDGRVAGYCLLALSHSNEAGGLNVFIEEVYVSKEFRSKGLGTELIEFIFSEYKNKAARFRLEIEPTNDRARKLYKSLGFNNLNYEQLYK